MKKQKIISIIIFILFSCIFSYFTRFYEVTTNKVLPPGNSYSISKKYNVINYYNPNNNGCVISMAVDSKTKNNIGKLSWGYIYANDVKVLLEDSRTNKKIIKELEREQEFLQEQLGDKYNAGTKSTSEYGKEDYWVTAYYDFDLTEPYVVYEVNFWAKDFDINDKGLKNVLKYFGLNKCYDSKTEYFTLKKLQKNKNKIRFGEIFDFITDRNVVDMKGNVIEGNTENTDTNSSTNENTSTSSSETTEDTSSASTGQ